MGSDARRWVHSSDGDDSHEEYARLLSLYLDRLNRGEFVDPDQVLSDHRDLGERLLTGLEAFLDIVPDDGTSAPLGTLGDYSLRRRIGRGGMGVVYEAWEHSMGRTVALKVLPPGVAADDTASARFQREAQLAGQLSHEHIVRVYSTGIHEGTPWFSMEYVEGESLAQILAMIKEAEPETETPFGLKDELAYFSHLASAFAGVADGLQHAHEKGISHRDIKPSNLILDGDNCLRILDFGLARLEGQESLTLSGEFVGTPLYVSPEQARRKSISVDHRTDVYSLGATTYEAICGRPPFRGKDHADTLSQIIEHDPVEPRQVNPRVPKDLETVVLKCLRKDAADRYGTAEALAQDLRRFVRGDPVEARPLSRGGRIWRRLLRARLPIVLSLVVAAVAIGSVWLVVARRSAERSLLLSNFNSDVHEAAVMLLAGRFSLEAGTEDSRTAFSFWERGPLAAQLREIFVSGVAESLQRVVVSLDELSQAVPEKPDAHYHLARAQVLLERFDDASRSLDRTFRADARFIPARILEWELSSSSSVPGVERAARMPTAQSLTGWPALWYRADRAFRDERWSLAAEDFGQLAALRDEPFVGSEVECHLRRGVALLALERWTEAQGSFIVARRLADGPAGALEPTLLLAKAYYLGGRPDLAKTTIDEQRARLRGVEMGDKLAVLAWAVYDALHDHSAAIEWAEKIVDSAVSARLEAFSLLRRGDTREGIVAAVRAMAHDSADPVAPRIAALALLRDLWAKPRGDAEYTADVEQLLVFARRAVVTATDDQPVATTLPAHDPRAREVHSPKSCVRRSARWGQCGGFPADADRRALGSLRERPRGYGSQHGLHRVVAQLDGGREAHGVRVESSAWRCREDPGSLGDATRIDGQPVRGAVSAGGPQQ